MYKYIYIYISPRGDESGRERSRNREGIQRVGNLGALIRFRSLPSPSRFPLLLLTFIGDIRYYIRYAMVNAIKVKRITSPSSYPGGRRRIRFVFSLSLSSIHVFPRFFPPPRPSPRFFHPFSFRSAVIHARRISTLPPSCTFCDTLSHISYGM